MTHRKSPPTTALDPSAAAGFFIRRIVHPEWTEYHLTASARDYSPDEWTARVIQFLEHKQAVAVRGTGFGPAELLRALQTEGAKSERLACPWSFLAGRMKSGARDGGYHLHAISGVNLSPIYYGNRHIGSRFEDSSAVYALLSDLRPTTSHSAAAQAEEVFSLTDSALRGAGLDFHDVVRTWFFLDRILDWYGDFNRVRTAFFETHKIFGGLMPASTGVGAANLAGAALLAQAYAVRPKSDAVRVSRVDSPLQCDAYQYGSAFSRAVEVTDASSRALFISGTASIEPGGKTVHTGDTGKQIDLTLQVVEAILASRDFSWRDIVSAIAYFRDPADIPLWQKGSPPLPAFPVVVTQCDVCRDDLLFEIELQVASSPAA